MPTPANSTSLNGASPASWPNDALVPHGLGQGVEVAADVGDGMWVATADGVDGPRQVVCDATSATALSWVYGVPQGVGPSGHGTRGKGFGPAAAPRAAGTDGPTGVEWETDAIKAGACDLNATASGVSMEVAPHDEVAILSELVAY